MYGKSKSMPHRSNVFGLINKCQPCFANVVKLNSCDFWNPSSPSSFEWHGLSQPVYRIPKFWKQWGNCPPIVVNLLSHTFKIMMDVKSNEEIVKH